MKKTLIATAISTIPGIVQAAAMSGGGGAMPYSAGLGKFSTSVTTEIAMIVLLIAVVGGVAYYLSSKQLEGLLDRIVQIGIAAGVVGGAVVLFTTFGFTGAIV
jgi:hypothetical protein